jgi:hypothetical protein
MIEHDLGRWEMGCRHWDLQFEECSCDTEELLSRGSCSGKVFGDSQIGSVGLVWRLAARGREIGA